MHRACALTTCTRALCLSLLYSQWVAVELLYRCEEYLFMASQEVDADAFDSLREVKARDNAFVPYSIMSFEFIPCDIYMSPHACWFLLLYMSPHALS